MRVTLEREGHVATVTFSNPPTHTLTDPMVRELETHVSDLELDPPRVVVFRGAGDGIFIAHYEVGELSASADAQQVPGASRTDDRELHRFHRVLLRLEHLPSISVAAIDGHAAGGGCEFTLACDFRLLANGPYRYGLPETVVGIIPGGGGTQRLPRLIGEARALDLILHAQLMNPAEALALGLVHRLFPPERFDAEVEAFVTDLAGRAPIALAAAKAAIRRGLEGDLERGLGIEQEMFGRTMRSEDAAGAMRAWLDQKPYAWKGR